MGRWQERLRIFFFFFSRSENLTTAEGGAATWRSIPGIDDEELYHQFQLYSLHGQSKDALAKHSLARGNMMLSAPGISAT